MESYTVKGKDQYGNDAEETFHYVRATFIQRVRMFAVRVLGLRLAYAIGLSKTRIISKITVAK